MCLLVFQSLSGVLQPTQAHVSTNGYLKGWQCSLLISNVVPGISGTIIWHQIVQHIPKRVRSTREGCGAMEQTNPVEICTCMSPFEILYMHVNLYMYVCTYVRMGLRTRQGTHQIMSFGILNPGYIMEFMWSLRFFSANMPGKTTARPQFTLSVLKKPWPKCFPSIPMGAWQRTK